MNIANRLSILRILLVPIFVGLLIYFTPERSFLYGWSIGVFILACVTDGVDGYLARRLHQKTVLGSYLDPVADKLLLLSGFLSLSFMGHLPGSIRIPAWVAIPVIARDAIILIGSAIIFLTTSRLRAEPLLIGKITTFIQMATLFIALISAPKSFQMALNILTVVFTVFSGVQYIKMGNRLVQTNEK